MEKNEILMQSVQHFTRKCLPSSQHNNLNQGTQAAIQIQKHVLTSVSNPHDTQGKKKSHPEYFYSKGLNNKQRFTTSAYPREMDWKESV